MKLFAVKFRRILKVFYTQVLQKSSGRSSTIFVSKNEAASYSKTTMKICATIFVSKNEEESSGQIFTIYVSKHEAFCCEVQMHFSKLSACKIDKKVVGAFSRFV